MMRHSQMLLGDRSTLICRVLVSHGGLLPENDKVTLGIKGQTIRNAIEVIRLLDEDGERMDLELKAVCEKLNRVSRELALQVFAMDDLRKKHKAAMRSSTRKKKKAVKK